MAQRRRSPRRRSVRLQGRGAAAGREWQAAAIPAKRRSKRFVRQGGPVDRAMGASITAGAPASAPTRCRLRRPCICRWVMSAATWRAGGAAGESPPRAAAGAAASAGNFAGQIGLGVERAQLGREAEAARVAAETESLRNTLLASISHDLRTPLAVIAGASSTLAEHGDDLDAATRTTLARSIETKAREMSELVSNVLDLMRFESGQDRAAPRLADARRSRSARRCSAHRRSGCSSIRSSVRSRRRPAAGACGCEPDRAGRSRICSTTCAKYTPPATPVHDLRASRLKTAVRVTVDDDGPGLAAGGRERLFDKFQRGDDEGTIVGAGLGLAICRAIVRAHGGEIEAGDAAGRRRAIRVHAADEGSVRRDPGACIKCWSSRMMPDIRGVLRVLLRTRSTIASSKRKPRRAPRSKRAVTSRICCWWISACRTATA